MIAFAIEMLMVFQDTDRSGFAAQEPLACAVLTP